MAVCAFHCGTSPSRFPRQTLSQEVAQIAEGRRDATRDWTLAGGRKSLNHNLSLGQSQVQSPIVQSCFRAVAPAVRRPAVAVEVARLVTAHLLHQATTLLFCGAPTPRAFVCILHHLFIRPHFSK